MPRRDGEPSQAWLNEHLVALLVFLEVLVKLNGDSAKFQKHCPGGASNWLNWTNGHGNPVFRFNSEGQLIVIALIGVGIVQLPDSAPLEAFKHVKEIYLRHNPGLTTLPFWLVILFKMNSLIKLWFDEDKITGVPKSVLGDGMLEGEEKLKPLMTCLEGTRGYQTYIEKEHQAKEEAKERADKDRQEKELAKMLQGCNLSEHAGAIQREGYDLAELIKADDNELAELAKDLNLNRPQARNLREQVAKCRGSSDRAPHSSASPTTTTSSITVKAVTTSGGLDVFISLRFGESLEASKALKLALEQLGYRVFLCAVAAGEDIMEEIIENIGKAKMVVIMGTLTYGKQTASSFSTREELKFIVQEKKPMFLVKMCDKFEETFTRFTLGDNIMYEMWKPSTPAQERAVPAPLLNKIVQKFNSL